MSEKFTLIVLGQLVKDIPKTYLILEIGAALVAVCDDCHSRCHA